MLELILCSMVTVLPDYLLRRYLQNKRWGHEITFVSMWYELRWGITACVLLTVSLITVIFYFHPATTHASPFFRTVTILPEKGGRVEQIFVRNLQTVNAGDPLFSLYDDTQFSAVQTATAQVAQVEAEFTVANSELAAAKGSVDSAKAALAQAQNELRMKQELAQKGRNLVSEREVDRLINTVDTRKGGLAAAQANEQAIVAKISTVLPARKKAAEDALQQAQVELDKTIVYAGISGQLQQFILQPGDYISPMMRPAGLLIPTQSAESGRKAIHAGFHQLSAQVIQPGTLAEATCLSKPFTIIPMVVTSVADVIAAGQLRPTDTLLDVQDRARPGTLTVQLEPLYSDGLTGVFPGTKCIVNAYSNHHALLESGEASGAYGLFLHGVDAVGVVHAIILRIQALLLPVQNLVFG